MELDDGYVGGPSHNGKRVRGTDKAKIVVAVSKAENGVPLFARMKVVENVQRKTLQEIIDQYFAPNTKVVCDGSRSYLNLEGVELNVKKYETYNLHWTHKAISNLKPFLLGAYHGRCTKLQAYWDEYGVRFNCLTGNQIPASYSRCRYILWYAELSR